VPPPSPLPPVHSMCSAGGCVCRRVCVDVLCARCGVHGVGEAGRRRALAGVWCFCFCVSWGLLSHRPSLPPSSHFAFPSAVFVRVCVIAMAVHRWPLGLAPTSPSSCCHIHRGIGGLGWGRGGGRWSCPYIRAVLQGDPHPCTLAHPLPPHAMHTHHPHPRPPRPHSPLQQQVGGGQEWVPHDGCTATHCAVCRGTHGSEEGHMTVRRHALCSVHGQ
jgi:hypothetical protein